MTTGSFIETIPTPPVAISPEARAALIESEIRLNKELRRDIDAIIQRVKALPGSAERTLSYRSLQVGLMWLGMDLKRLGAENPYPHSKDPSNTIVEPTADGLTL